MDTITFPSILSPTIQNWWLDARSRSGGETASGREPVVSSGLARWRATLTFPLYSRNTILAYRSWIVQMDGRSNQTIIGPCDCANSNRLGPVIGGIPHSDQTMHSDNAGYAQGGVAAQIVSGADAGDVEVTIWNGSTELPVLAGSFIGLAGYLYVVVGVTALPGAESRLTIRPRLRTAVADGAIVEWCHARCPMRLMADDSGSFDLQLGRYGAPTIDLVEVW